MTSRLDVIELLEKRVKSRFSHRQIFLHPGESFCSETQSSAFDDRMELFVHLLSLPDDENVNERDEINHACNIEPKFAASWNKQIKTLADNPTVQNLLKQMYTDNTSEREFRNFLAVAISSLCSSHQELDVNDFVKASKCFTQEDKILMLEGLSVLELCLVIIFFFFEILMLFKFLYYSSNNFF